MGSDKQAILAALITECEAATLEAESLTCGGDVLLSDSSFAGGVDISGTETEPLLGLVRIFGHPASSLRRRGQTRPPFSTRP